MIPSGLAEILEGVFRLDPLGAIRVGSQSSAPRRLRSPARRGATGITTETGAGQWGSALSIAGALFGVEIKVFMVRVSFDQKPYRKAFMRLFNLCGHGHFDMAAYDEYLAGNLEDRGCDERALSRALTALPSP